MRVERHVATRLLIMLALMEFAIGAVMMLALKQVAIGASSVSLGCTMLVLATVGGKKTSNG